MQVRCPPIDDALIHYLATVFPDTVIAPETLDPHQALGRQDVVRHLRMVSNEQQESTNVYA